MPQLATSAASATAVRPAVRLSPVAQYGLLAGPLALGIGLAATAYLRAVSARYPSMASASPHSRSPRWPALWHRTGRLCSRPESFRVLVAAPLVPMAMSMLLGKSRSARSIPATAGMLLYLGPALGPSCGSRRPAHPGVNDRRPSGGPLAA